MREFGSDFHLAESFRPADAATLTPRPSGTLYACGRHALEALLLFGMKNSGWRRIWIPEYFCGGVTAHIARTGIGTVFYPDSPESDDRAVLQSLPFSEGDAVLRMNYFGLRSRRSSRGLGVPVIEDHSHGVLSEWALGSDADYCIASLRKTVPLAGGGAAWSPSGKSLPPAPAVSAETERLCRRRAEAMRLKRDYLAGGPVRKEEFRNIYIETEQAFDTLPLSAMSTADCTMLSEFDTAAFYRAKKENFGRLTAQLSEDIEYLRPESGEETPFSLVLKLGSSDRLARIKQKLTDSCVYPAHLWPLPPQTAERYGHYLSIHCDGRYSAEDMDELARLINQAYRHD